MKSYYTNDLIPKSIEKSTYHREKKVLLPEVRVLLTSFMICETMVMLPDDDDKRAVTAFWFLVKHYVRDV